MWGAAHLSIHHISRPPSSPAPHPPRPPAPQADSSVDAFDRGGGSVNESRWACWFPFTLPPPRSDASRLPRACGAGGRGGWGAGEVLTPIGAGGVRGNRSEKALQDVTNPQAAHPLVAARRASPARPRRTTSLREVAEGRSLLPSCASTTRRSRCGGGSPRSEAERRGGAQHPTRPSLRPSSGEARRGAGEITVRARRARTVI